MCGMKILFFVYPQTEEKIVVLSHSKKINSKSFSEKGQEIGMLWETKFLTTTPILRSVQYIFSELSVETFHATL